MVGSDWIFFIYDDVLVLREEDDPAEAISYFYPESMTSEHQCWLCGKLISLSRSVSRLLGHPPETIKLQKKKFSLLQSYKYAIFLGVPVDGFSDLTAMKICKYIADVLLFSYPTLDYLISSLPGKSHIDSILNTIFSSPWIFLEFQVTSFVGCKELRQPIMLKCADILEFCCRHNGIFGCCLLLQTSVIQSLMGPKITRLAQLCTSCPAFDCQQKKVIGHSCRFVPVFILKEDYNEIVMKQRKKYRDDEWEPHSYVEYEDGASSQDETCLRKEVSEKPRTQNTTANGKSASQQLDFTMTSSKTCDSLTCPETKELSLFVFKEREVSLVIQMEKYSEQYSLKLAKAMIQECLWDLKYLSQELSEIPEFDEENKDQKESIENSSTTGRVEDGVDGNKNAGGDFESLVAAAREDFNDICTMEEVQLKDTKGVFRCERSFDNSKFSLEKRPTTK